MKSGFLRAKQQLIRFTSKAAVPSLQPFWMGLAGVSQAGMGLLNSNSETNGEYRFLRSWIQLACGPDATPLCIDAGANEGDFAALITALCPTAQVACFEPNPPTADRLRSRFSGNPRITVEQMGLGEANGQFMLLDYADASGSEHASFVSDYMAMLNQQEMVATATPVVTLSDWLQRQGLMRIDLLKVDVEGWEAEVLRGADALISSGNLGCVIFEWNQHAAFLGNNLYEITQILASHDIFRILPKSLYPLRTDDVSYSPRVDLFAYGNYAAIPRSLSPQLRRQLVGPDAL